VETADALTLARLSPGALCWYDLRSEETGESVYEQPPHLKLLDDEIVALVNGWGEYADDSIKGIIFTVPPRHGKSFKVSHYTPAWYLGRFPQRHVGLCSYEADFAASWGKKAREVLEARGPEIFNVEVDHTSRAASAWRIKELKRGRPIYGSMVTAGIGGPLTGRGLHLLIIDDPVKNALEAHSKAKRQAVWDWYTSTAATRLEPGGKIIIIMTRWHDDDLAGRLIREMEDGHGWKFKVINLPALALEDDPLGRVPGEALWPGRYPVERLDEIREGLGPYVWNALFQGKPADKAGGFFDPYNFRVVGKDERDSKPVKAVRRWDLAATEDAGDYTAGVLLEKLANGRWLVADVRRGQWESDEIERQIVQAALDDGPNVKVRFEQERGAAGKLIVAHYRRLLRGKTNGMVKGEVPTGDIEVRALGVSAASNKGLVDIADAPWNADFLAECGAFPHGVNDDMVSALSGAWFDMEKGGTVVNF
jgi:predicted phage terminase large subunit-like protein